MYLGFADLFPRMSFYIITYNYNFIISLIIIKTILLELINDIPIVTFMYFV